MNPFTSFAMYIMYTEPHSCKTLKCTACPFNNFVCKKRPWCCHASLLKC